jgi:hypothetical protein
MQLTHSACETAWFGASTLEPVSIKVKKKTGLRNNLCFEKLGFKMCAFKWVNLVPLRLGEACPTPEALAAALSDSPSRPYVLTYLPYTGKLGTFHSTLFCSQNTDADGGPCNQSDTPRE